MLKPLQCLGIFLAFILAYHRVAAELPSNAIELDLIFPRAGGVYAETERDLPVLLSLQNPEVAYHYGWSLEWSVYRAIPGTASFWQMGYFGARLKNDTRFEGDNTTFLSDVIGKLPAGEYRFTFDFRISAWCRFIPGEVEYGSSPRLNNGNFTFTVAQDAPTPTFTGSCPSAIGSASFAELTTWHGLIPSLDPPRETPTSCAVTANITHETQPCSATAGEAQEASLSSRLRWGEAYATEESTASPTGAAGLTVPGLEVVALVGMVWMASLAQVLVLVAR